MVPILNFCKLYENIELEIFNLNKFDCQIYTIWLYTSYTTYIKFSPDIWQPMSCHIKIDQEQ